jgi:rifampicin phosphotransferase
MGEHMQERWITDRPTSTRWPHYTRANAGEVLPTPASPLGQQFSWSNGMLLGWGDGYVRSGQYTNDEWERMPPDVAEFHGGYFYINLANVRMQGVRSPAVTVEQLDMAFFGGHPDVPPYVAHPQDERPELTENIVAHLGWMMTTSEWKEFDDERTSTKALRSSRPDLTQLTDAELVARARSTQPMLRKLFESHALTSSASGVAPGILFAVGEAIGDPTSPMKIVAGRGDVDSAEPSYALWDLSRFINSSKILTAEFDKGLDGLLGRLEANGSAEAQVFLRDGAAFLAEFGSRGPNEWEMSADTWETKPDIALAALNSIRRQSDNESPRARQLKQKYEADRATADVRTKVLALGNDELTGNFEAALVAANQLSFRERTKTNIVRVVHEGRMVFRELGRRHADAGNIADASHIFMLLDEEVEPFIAKPSSFKATLAERYATWREIWTLEPPFFIKDGKVPPMTEWPKKSALTAKRVEAGEVIQGVPGCPGLARGRACVILDPSDADGLAAGDILVAPLTDPAWTPLFMAAAGVVVNVGGQISHAIIVSRELGLPCVVSATDATARIPNGALIEVDGSTGQVTIISLP